MTVISDSENFLLGVLDAVEQRESRLLVWGLVDGRLARQELNELIDPLLDQALEQGIDEFYSADDVVRALSSRGLLFETDEYPYAGFRSRMAETVRLAFRLRQLFQKHAGVDGWNTARTLVADFRFTRRQRRYPKRDLLPEEVLKPLLREVGDGGVQTSLETLIAGRGEDFRFAGFQARATERILQSLVNRRVSGTLISAGTGSGKTLAFYLPAMARIGALRSRGGNSPGWVKLLAIYPRTELLRDQFAEVYGEARRLDNFLVAGGAGKIRIGALFGETPQNGNALKRSDGTWRRVPEGWVCGFMACPQTGCGAELIWRVDDLERNHEQLVCARCSHSIPGDELVLTREKLRSDPPDILFTTTEMLNQRMSDTGSRHLFGLRPGATRPPEMVLLDEVHTYSGNHGAQVGYLLRRWRHLVRAPVTFVGLSATLRDGVRFFSRLTGLEEYQVEEVAPRVGDLVAEGAEYLLALRGDPVSRAALLSTTIQTAMLMMRVMDPANDQLSHGLFGQRVFAFTDDIDVTNRLYFGVLDAEGRNDRGDPDPVRHPEGPLAVLRRPLQSDSRERAGQNWDMPEAIGHRLDDRKRIGRTSSQDPGVTRGLDLIVATASLEVGFNDPGVGGVIQHKAPRDAAQFIQRKGRAGRPRGMRPWTVVVLSDYGRDRSAYQGYEQLFDPEIRPRRLPFSSRYIQRMQATYALLDFLASELGPSLARGSAWWSLSQPNDLESRYADLGRRRQQALVGLLVRLLDDSQALVDLSDHLCKALQLSEREVEPLLWEYPRPILGSVIPTALRRLSTNWRAGQIPESDFVLRNNPLPEFIPASLFSDLNLPEVSIALPPSWQGDDPDRQMMGIEQGLRTFAPGRVSRRFGIKYSSIRHWVAPEDGGRNENQLEVSRFYGADFMGRWRVGDDRGAYEVPVFRPYEIRPVSPEKEIGDTSNAFLNWRSQIVAVEPGITLEIPKKSPWEELLDELTCFRHVEHAPVEVRRFALGSDADIRVQRGEDYKVRFEFVEDGQPAAIGYAMSVDALRVAVHVPEDLLGRVQDRAELERSVRTERYFDATLAAEKLPMVDNPFMRDWLATVYFSALVQQALVGGISLAQAAEKLRVGEAELDLADVLESLFQSPRIDVRETEGNSKDGSEEHLRRDLEGMLDREDVLDGLGKLARLLWEPIDDSWEIALKKRFVATIGAAALEAICDLCPEVDSSSLILDVDPGPRDPGDLYEGTDGTAEVWISEVSPGGSGAIEEFLSCYSQDPRRYFSLLQAQLEPNEYAHTDYQLRRILSAVSGDTPDEGLLTMLRSIRSARNSVDTDMAIGQLRAELAGRGFVLYHSFLSAVSTRVIRPGSTQASDSYLHSLVEEWQQEEARLGVELDSRSIAYRWSREDQIDQVLAGAGIPLPDSEHRLAWRFNAVYGLLWRRGREVRRVGLEPYNPFCDLPLAERALVSACLSANAEPVNIEDPAWREKAIAHLTSAGLVTLTTRSSERSAMASAMLFFAVNPVESDYLSLYARVAGYRQLNDRVEVDLEVEEVLR